MTNRREAVGEVSDVHRTFKARCWITHKNTEASKHAIFVASGHEQTKCPVEGKT